MSYYYRKPNKDNYEDDIKNLNNKIDIVYTSLENIIQDRNDLLVLFLSWHLSNTMQRLQRHILWSNTSPTSLKTFRTPKIHQQV